MISHKHKFIFIQIPKTGCTSAQKVLEKHGGIVKQGPTKKKSIYFKHRTYSEMQESNDFEKIKEYFSFTFVRNPWDWLVSNYFYCRGIHSPYRNRGTKNSIKKSKDLKFEPWLYWYINGMKGTQKEMIVDSSGEINIDFIGKLENYQSDFNKVCDKLNIKRIQLPHLNTTKHKSYKKYYNPDTIKLVERAYAEDIDCFKYKFGE
jgi:hypothetical protein